MGDVSDGDRAALSSSSIAKVHQRRKEDGEMQRPPTGQACWCGLCCIQQRLCSVTLLRDNSRRQSRVAKIGERGFLAVISYAWCAIIDCRHAIIDAMI